MKRRPFAVLTLLSALALSGCAGGGGGQEEAQEGPPLPSGRTVEETLANRVNVPDVIGMLPEDASSTLEAAGFAVTVEGEGDEVIAQFPAPRSSVDEGSEVEITVASTGPAGTRADPFPFGTTLARGGDVDAVTVALGAAQWGADATVAAENMFNDAAPAGMTYVLLPVTITNISSVEPVTPYREIDVAYVAPDGRSYDQAYVVIPNALSDIGDLYEGGSATGNVVFALPADAQGGVWAVSHALSEPVFVAAGQG